MKHLGLFAAGVLFGTAGLKILGSKDAKKVYAHTTAAVLRAKDASEGPCTTVREGAEMSTPTPRISTRRALRRRKLPSWRTLRKRKRPQQNNCFPEGPLPRSSELPKKLPLSRQKECASTTRIICAPKARKFPHLRMARSVFPAGKATG